MQQLLTQNITVNKGDIPTSKLIVIFIFWVLYYGMIIHTMRTIK